MIEKFNYNELISENNFVQLKIVSVENPKNYYPNLNVKIWNKTQNILFVQLEDFIFLTHERIEISTSITEDKIRLLPNTGQIFKVSVRNREYLFTSKDLLISTILINEEKYVLGSKVGKVSNKVKNVNSGGCCLILVILMALIIIGSWIFS